MTWSKQIRTMASVERELSELLKRPAQKVADVADQLASSTLRRAETINMWSQNNKVNQEQKTALKRPNPLRTGRTRRSGPTVSMTLSIAFSLILAAVHSRALVSDSLASSGHQNSSPASSSLLSLRPSDSDKNQLNQRELNKSASQQQNQKSLQPATSSSGALATKPLANLNSESVSINLIPVDQPMLSSSSSSAEVGPTSPASIARTMSAQTNSNNNNVRPDDSYDGSRVHLRSGQMAPVHSDSSHANSSPESNDDFSGLSQQHQQQQSASDEDFAEPVAQYYANQDEPAAGPVNAQQAASVDSQQLEAAHSATKQSQSPARQLERRFGLFKKGQGHFQQQHFGPAANYLANPFMSECERCLAGFGQQQTGELQLEPAPALPVPSPPPPATVPIQPLPSATMPPQMGHFPMQPFAPFKNKFFMKFPFLMKGNGASSTSFDHLHAPLLAAPTLTSYSSPAHYWPLPAASVHTYSGHHHQSSHNQHRPMSQALFVRPAPAYNCVQAAPTMLAAAASTTSQSETIPLLGQTKSSALTGGGGTPKQHHYAHQQQQVQSGYAKK